MFPHYQKLATPNFVISADIFQEYVIMYMNIVFIHKRKYILHILLQHSWNISSRQTGRQIDRSILHFLKKLNSIQFYSYKIMYLAFLFWWTFRFFPFLSITDNFNKHPCTPSFGHKCKSVYTIHFWKEMC